MEEEEEEDEEEDEKEETGEQNSHKPLECLSESPRMSLGSLLEASWGVLGVSWRYRGALGRLGRLGGASGGRLESS